MTTNKERETTIFDNIKDHPDFFIRRCTIEDLDGVIEVNERELPEDYPYFFYKSILDEFPESFLVAKNTKGDIIAYVMWRVEKAPSVNSLKYVNKAHLVSIAVSEQYRRRGIGTTLLANSMAAIKKYKIHDYVLEVRVSNYIAMRLYEKFNFEIETIKKHYYRDNENAYFMTLSVKSF
ncbi:MAG: GNAT family N-acetyltransferase [Candidatus Hodarchaeota archaeon]